MPTADPTGHRLRLGDLLAEDSFDLELLAGDADAAGREVHGAHAVEVEQPARWLDADWVMLTAGVRLRGNVGAQRALVPELDAAGVAALGFGVELGFDRVPPAILDSARDHGFPVFAVPFQTPFREIIRFVDSSRTSGDEQVFRRLTALQRYLVDALRTPQPERAMVDRLARFLDVGVLLVGAGCRPEIVSGRLPVDELCEELRDLRAGLVELDVDGWHAVATPVLARPDGQRWLVLASQRQGFVGKLAKPAAQATAPLLAAMARLGEVVHDQELAVKSALLEEALEPIGARDVPPLAARIAAFGLDFSRPARLAVIRGHPARRDGGPPVDLAGVHATLVAKLEAARVPHLVRRGPDALTVLVQGDDRPLLAALGALSEAIPDVVVGVGRPLGSLAAAHHSLRDAELAAARGAIDAERSIVRFEDFDLSTFMVSEISPERLGAKVDEILVVLRANPPVHEALRAYFAHDLDISATAAALHMHRNSLRYRLARAEQLLGRSLKRPSTIAAVYVALVAEAAGHGAPAGPPAAERV
jgi:purine catabolism regulator